MPSESDHLRQAADALEDARRHLEEAEKAAVSDEHERIITQQRDVALTLGSTVRELMVNAEVEAEASDDTQPPD